MLTTRSASGLVLLVIVSAACSIPRAGGSPVPTAATATVEPEASTGDLPAVQSTSQANQVVVESITRDQISGEASRALGLCGMLDALDNVVAVVFLERLADTRRYIPFDGFVPEFEGEASGWVVATDFDMPFGGRVYHDPTCILVDGAPNPGVYGTGGFTEAGIFYPPGDPTVEPDLDLPAFQP